MRTWPWTLLVHALFLNMAAYIIRPAAAYRALELDVDPAYLGLIAASFAVVPLLLAVVVGRATDAGRGPLVLGVGAALMVAAGIGLLLWSDSLVLLLAWNIVIGTGHLLSVIGQQTRIAQEDARTLDHAFGLYTFAGTAGQALGPLMITVLGGDLLPDTRILFAAYTAATVALLVLTGFLLHRSTGSSTPQATPPPSLRAALTAASPAARRELFAAMAISMIVLSAVDLVAVYLPALGVERGIPAAVIGVLLALRAVATMASRIFMARMVRALGRWRLITYSTAASALAVAALALPAPVWLLGVILVAAGLALGIGQPLSMTVITLAAPPGTRGTWLALRLSANRFGQSGIPAAVGLVAAAAGVAGVFATTAVGLAVAAAGSWVAYGRR
ncbi:MFS transporter [Citricoccus nitrophenolicus]|uniref:MFS transporter n=1 Tax=Citricoccus nitrophenolicus TaxID=863575 RepID=UPI0039B4359D